MNNNFEFLKKYQKIQYGIWWDKLIKLANSSVVYSETDPSEYSNWAFVFDPISKDDLFEIEKTMESLNRGSAVYFENCPELKVVADFLLQNGYSKKWEDSWMFYAGGEIDQNRFESVKKVTNEDELKVFLDTFDQSYQKDDPNNPYGNVKSFIPGCKKAWEKFGNTNRLQYFIAYKDSEPVATAILNSLNGLGYISAVGSKRSVRGEGFGKLVTLYAVYQSQLLRNKDHALATEEGTYPNEFYKRIGFKTRFTAPGYMKIVKL
jgi:ribosomal protein S18 acetylase RimI-like enzyme